MKSSNVAFIPVRGGSKSIPLKNIKPLCGRPLIYWALDAAVNCSYIDKVYVSTDHEKIVNAVKEYANPKVEVFMRSPLTATDTASTESAMLEFAENNDFDSIALIQATSPLLTSHDLDKGFACLEKDSIDSVLSVVRQKRFVWERNQNGSVTPVNYDYLNRPLRQNFDGYLVENGAFYITSKNCLLSSKCRISGNIECVEMEEDSYFEIDEPSDWMIVEELLGRRNRAVLLKEIIADIKCFITDSDGVLTDGGMYYSENGDESKKFCTYDGMAFELLRKNGIITGIITGEDVNLVRRRGLKLKVDELHLGAKDKLRILHEICLKYNIKMRNIAYIGDDINDLSAIGEVGFGCAVNNANKQVKRAAKYITKTRGGYGAVREVVDLILRNK